MWPYVIEEIEKSPLVGYGRMAMIRIGLAGEMREIGLEFSHPHNVYLDTLLDNGIVGSLPIFLFWGLVLIYSTRLFRSKDTLSSVIGGVVFSLTFAQLVSGIGSQHYYPRISTFGLWAGTFIMLRVKVAETQVGLISLNNQYVTAESLSQPYIIVDSSYIQNTDY